MRRGPRRHHNPNGHIQPLTVNRVEKLLYGAPLPDIHAQKRLEEAREQAQIHLLKEKAMPDMKSALEAALQKQQQVTLHQTLEDWAKEDEQVQQAQQPQEKAMTQRDYYFKPTNNVTRATFDYILNNPGQTFEQICKALAAQGYKKSSFTSLISQMRRSDIVRRDSLGCYTATTAQYVPIRSAKLKVAAEANKHRNVHRMKPGPKPKMSAPVQAPVQQVVTTVSNDIEYILSTLPIKQARALYDELHKIFGRSQ